MNWYIGMRRLGLILSVLYWIWVVKVALIGASTGYCPYGLDPPTFIVCAFFFYLFWYGLFWALSGFFTWERGRE
jgi:hypothetical protein